MHLKVLLPNGKIRSYSADWKGGEAPVGYRVLVPTGKGGTTGIVVGIGEGEAMGRVLEFPDPAPLINSSGLSLVEELSADYMTPKGVLLFRLLPSAFLWREEEILVVSERRTHGLDKRSLELIEYLRRRRGVKPENLKKRFDPSLIKLLLRKGFISLKKEWRTPDVEERFYSLNIPLKEALTKVRSKEKKKLIVFLSGRELVSEEELLEWGFKKRDINDLLKKGIIALGKEKPSPLRQADQDVFKPLRKTLSDRVLLWSSFDEAIDEVASLSAHNLEEGRSTLVIFPDYGELKLAVELFKRQMGGDLVEIHSRVPSKRVYEGWFRAQERASLVVGTYLSILCPAKDLSSIVLFDESSAGVKLRHIRNLDLRRAVFILSRKSASDLLFTTPAPSLSSYYLVREKRVELMDRHVEPETLLLRREPVEVLTEDACKLVGRNRDKSILFLVPKQGYSYVYCPRCEALVECPRCGTFLTYSLRRELLYCTNCFYKQEELLCPECEGELEEVGFGLERAVEVVEENFGLRENFHFSTHPSWECEYDIVVVLSADSLLSIPSYRAREELILYLLRARSIAKETLVVQTLLPEERVFSKMKEGKLWELYEEELKERERELLPPFWRLLLIKTTNPELERYVFKVVSPNVRSTYNVQEGCYELLIRFKERKTLWKVRQLMKRFSRDIIEVRVDPF